MSDVFVASDNIITSLGFSTGENASNMLKGMTGIRLTEDEGISPSPFYASLVDTDRLTDLFSKIYYSSDFTRFEQMAILSVTAALSGTDLDISSNRTLFILSTTKGNINLLEGGPGRNDPGLYLWHTARRLGEIFKFRTTPVVISNACISGLQAVIAGSRLIRAGYYDNVIVNGTDIITEFVVSGFNSFKSLSTGPCRPFDITRDGLSLGEGSGTIILTNNRSCLRQDPCIMVGEGFSSNDANHISGPSRTGEGLFTAVDRIIKKTPAIDFISAHGTGTLYNDEMEAIALTRAGLKEVPVSSFKGYWGHTLGAAGVTELVMCLYTMKNNVLFKTEGYNEPGLKNNLNIVDRVIYSEVNSCLKIASGFGGCNAALYLYRA